MLVSGESGGVCYVCILHREYSYVLLAERVYCVRLCISEMRVHFWGIKGETISAADSTNTATMK